jgi:serine/threonine protein kinase
MLSDFSGKIRLSCHRCKKLLLDWPSEDKIPPANAAPQENLGITGLSGPLPTRTETSLRILAPEESATLHPHGDAAIEKTLEFGKIGEYKLLKRIGQGAMGVIYLGEHMDKKGPVAIKLLSQEMQKDINAVERFLQEARVHSRLVHPNIVRIYDVGYCSGTERLYLVMEFVDGESLEKILTTHGAISQKHSLKITIAVGHALEHALEQHIIHRDLKPANILIDRRTRRVKVTDLGLGKSAAEEKGLTLSGQMMGTPFYMPPEQIQDARKVDHRADIYALGATLYHMLTGRPPYSEYKGTLAIVQAKMKRDPIPMPKYIPNLSDAVLYIVGKAMAKKADDRYETPTRMIEDMEKALEAEG